MLLLPDRGKGRRDVKLAKADPIVGRNIELKVIARRELNGESGIRRFQHQFLDKSGDIAVGNDPQAVFLRGAETSAAWNPHIEVDPARCAPQSDKLGGRDKPAGGRAIRPPD